MVKKVNKKERLKLVKVDQKATENTPGTFERHKEGSKR